MLSEKIILIKRVTQIRASQIRATEIPQITASSMELFYYKKAEMFQWQKSFILDSDKLWKLHRLTNEKLSHSNRRLFPRFVPVFCHFCGFSVARPSVTNLKNNSQPIWKKHIFKQMLFFLVRFKLSTSGDLSYSHTIETFTSCKKTKGHFDWILL